MTRHGQRGVTLLELMISVTLVALISIGLSVAMHAGLTTMQKWNTRMTSTRRVLGAQRVLLQQVGGLMNVVGLCAASAQAAPEKMRFFQGEPNAMRFVSTYSLPEASRGLPQLLEYAVLPRENGEGVRLVVNEFPYAGPSTVLPLCVGTMPNPETGKPVPRYRDIAVGPTSFVLADRLAYCRFRFLEVPFAAPGTPPTKPERWVDRWVAERYPQAIRVEMAPLKPEPGQLQSMSMTLPVHAEKNVLFTYTDQ